MSTCVRTQRTPTAKRFASATWRRLGWNATAPPSEHTAAPSAWRGLLPMKMTTPPVPVKEAWHPSTQEHRDLIQWAWSDIHDELKELKARLGCDEAFIADMLRGMADGVGQG